MDTAPPQQPTRDAMAYAEVLVEVGWLHDAEIAVADALDANPDDREALSLFAKIKHMRGELSQTIACWTQLYGHGASAQRASVQLAALMNMAQDPERHAGEYLFLGDRQLARKPPGLLALEEAFSLFQARRPEEARERCSRVAARYRSSEPSMRKLAILAGAWISVLTGRLDDARESLESLGRERGFATDSDRLLALADVYQRLGAPDRLEAAIKIFRHLERSEQDLQSPWLLSRLAALHLRLGRRSDADGYLRRFDAAFRRSMHRPTFDSVVRVAAARYLPLRRLRSIEFDQRPVLADASPREQALEVALRGDLDRARLILVDHPREVLDDEYLADLLALKGLRDQALDLYLRALARDPDNLLVLGQVLDQESGRPSAAVRRHFSEGEAVGRTRSLLDGAIRAAPLRPSLWRALATLESIGGDEEQGARCAGRADALEQAARERSSPVGRVLSIGIYHFIGQAKGLVHEVWVHRSSVEPGRGGSLPAGAILGNLTPELLQSVRNTFFAVREYARSKFPVQTQDLFDYDYSFKLPKEDEPSGGLSAGLPSALAFLSTFLQRPVPQDLAFSGMLIADAHDVLTVRAVADADLKIAAAYHRNLRGLMLPRECEPALRDSLLVPPSVRDALVRYGSSIDDAVKLVWGAGAFVAN